jgi:acyl-CoA synthetase (AMP-forming)/AMP-acid ligase II
MIASVDNCIDTEINCHNFIDLLGYRAKNQPTQTAYTFLQYRNEKTVSLNYQELDWRARAIAQQLQSLNAVGKRALLVYQPGLDFITAFFGCLYAGVVAIPAYPPRRNQSIDRLLSIVEDSEATLALTSTSLLSQIEGRLQQHQRLASLLWLVTDTVTLEFAEEWQQPKLTANNLAFLQYTSGSTGKPKGVMISHGNIWHNSGVIHQCFAHSPQSQGVIWLPLYHDMGLIGGVLQPLYGGFPVTFMSSVDFLQKPYRWLQAISQFKATTSGGPNFAYELCVSKIKPEQLESLDLSSWKVAFTGAEPVRAETLEQFAATFAACGFRQEAFYPCYGMAETTLIISGGLTTSPPVVLQVDSSALEHNQIKVLPVEQENQRTIVGCGQTWLAQQVAIVDPESMAVCPDGKVGEIWVSGASVAQGYWQQAEETTKTFQAYTKDTEEGPFLRTGDLGFLQNGELFITGRIKDVIIIRGQNHYPHDIELTVEKSHAALRPSCGAAFAVEIKGQERLVVVQEVERSYLRKLNVSEVVSNIRQAVTAQHDLQVYATVLVKTGSIPKTSSGKVRRHACRNGFLNGSLNVVEDWSENPQCKTKFKHLQAEVESMIEQLASGK